MPASKTVRIVLAMNAAFSLIVGIDLLFTAGSTAQILFADMADWQTIALRVLGIGLLIFALDIFYMASNQFISKREVQLISLMDIGWVIGSVVLLIVYGYIFTNLGTILIEVVAVLVAGFAVAQFFGASRIVPPKSRVDVRAVGEKLHASVKRIVNAPVDTVWSVMTDHPGYADVASNISKVEVLSGNGIGMQRRCYGPKGETWRETCDVFEEGKAFGFNIHTEADDYPYPISDLRGRWSVEPKGAGSEFSIDIEARPKGGFLMQTLFKIAAKRQFKTVLIDLADGWSDRMEKEVSN